jgi:hypothetical protein
VTRFCFANCLMAWLQWSSVVLLPAENNDGVNMFFSFLNPPACPVCGKHNLIRIKRHFSDRLLSVFFRVWRYRCETLNCQWEGTRRAG